MLTDYMITTLHNRLIKEVRLHQFQFIKAIAREIGFSQPSLRAFYLGKSDGSVGLLESLSKRYGLTLKANK